MGNASMSSTILMPLKGIAAERPALLGMFKG
jgi:hypothetical protein